MVLRPEIGVSDRGEADGNSGLAWNGHIWSKELIYCGKCRLLTKKNVETKKHSSE